MKAITIRPRDHRTYEKTLPARDLQDSINIGCSRYSSVQIKDLAEQIKLILSEILPNIYRNFSIRITRFYPFKDPTLSVR